MKFRLPSPPRELSPNAMIRSKVHYYKRAKLVREYEHDVVMVAKSTLSHWRVASPMLDTAKIQVRAYVKNRRQLLDGDNALNWLKYFFDGLTKAGVFIDDRRLIHYPVIQEVKASIHGQLDAVVKACEPGDMLILAPDVDEHGKPIVIGGYDDA